MFPKDRQNDEFVSRNQIVPNMTVKPSQIIKSTFYGKVKAILLDKKNSAIYISVMDAGTSSKTPASGKRVFRSYVLLIINKMEDLHRGGKSRLKSVKEMSALVSKVIIITKF